MFHLYGVSKQNIKNSELMTVKSNNKLATWAIIAIIALLGLNGYQWFVNSQITTENTRQETELIEIEKVNAELDQDYQAALGSLEDMRGDNKELNDLIDSQKKELVAQKDKINNLIWSKRELNKAREEIQNMKSQTSNYLAELTTLRDQNALLASNNTKLQQENESLNVQYQQVAQARASLEQEKNVLAAEKEKLSVSNEMLGAKVDMANAIKINWMEIKGYKFKKNGDRKKRRRAKDIELLEVCFKTETNMVVPNGSTSFQVRIINPYGETISVENAGSGVLTNKLDNTKVRYTYEGLIDYQNEDTEGCASWKVSDDVQLSKGMYDLEMYNNGFLVGKGNFKLK